MTGTVLLVHPRSQSTEAIANGVALASNDVLERVADTDEALARLEQREHGIDALVLPPDLRDALRVAERAHALDAHLAILIVAEPGRYDELTNGLRSARFADADVTCVAEADQDVLAAAVAKAAARTRERRARRVAVATGDPAAAASLDAPVEQYLGHLLAHGPIGVVALDERRAVIGWNHRAGEIFGVAEPDVVGKPLAGLFPDPDGARLEDFVEQSLASDAETPAQVFERIAADGGPQFVEVRAAALTGRGGEPGAMMLVQDVTDGILAEEERRWMEEAVRFQKTLLESQSEASLEAMVVVSREGTILSVNRRFCDVWGIPDEGTGVRSGQAAREAVAEKVAAPSGFAARFVALSESSDETTHEQIILKDGRALAAYSGPVRSIDGLHYGRVWFFRDVTDVKRAEEQLQARAGQQATVAWLGQRALKVTNVQTLMEEAVALLADTLRVEYAKVLELLPDGDALLLRAGVGWGDGLVGKATVGAGTDSQAGYTLRANEPVIVEDLRTEQRFSGPPLLHDHSVVSGMSVVIEGREPAYGVIGVHTTEARTFTKDDVNFVQAIANVLGAAIERADADAERARLLEREQAARAEAERASERLRLIQAVSEAALAHSTLDDLLRELLTRITAALDVDTAAVLLLETESDILVTRTAKGLEEEVGYEVRVPTGTGFAGRIAAERRAIVMDEVDPKEIVSPILREKRVSSLLGVPLLVEGEVIGVLRVGTLRPRRFTDDDSTLLQLVGDRVALAIEQARLFEAERNARAEAETASSTISKVQAVTEAALAHLGLEDLLQALLSRIAAIVNADTVAILLMDEERNELVARAAHGLEEEVERGFRIRLGVGFAGRIAAERRPVYIRRLAPGDAVNPLLYEKGIRSLLGVPLVVGERVTGVLHVGSFEERDFTDEDARVLQLVADRAVLAIEQARLYEAERTARSEAQAAQKRLEFLAEATQLLAESLDYEATLGSVARLAIPTLADWCVVDEVRENGEINRVAVAAALPRKQELLEELQELYPPDWESPQPAAQALRTGEPVLFPEFPPDSLRATVRDEKHFELISELEPHAAIAIPLVAHGETMGAITFAFAESGRTYGSAELGLARELARRAALAIDRTRIYTREQRARVEAEAAQEHLSFLAQASDVLSSSLDYESTLRRVAELTVASLADWCVVHMEENGTVRQLEVAHADPEKEALVEAVQRRYPFDPSRPSPVLQVLATGESVLLPDIPDSVLEAAARDEEHLGILRSIGVGSAMIVPVRAGERPVGAITFIASDSGRRYSSADLALAEELARRAGLAVENARLYRAAEERANAARALATIADGVFLLDGRGVIRLWNPAAEAITGLPANAVVGRPADEAIPGWSEVAGLLPVAEFPGPSGSRPQTVPLEIAGRELWLSFSAVGFEDGTVYAFRDLTEERRLDELKTEFVATASHELRTPLAAVYGAAMTLRRKDLELDGEKRDLLLSVIAQEADRLARTINDILWASRLESGQIDLEIEPFDPRESGERVVDAARTHAPEGITLELVAPPDLPRLEGDSDKLRQVLANLVENAMKYSPDGGRVEVRIEPSDRHVRFAVADSGIGIPPREQARIFEKFYRLDPNLTRGVGGTGLGLYICRGLVRNMGGRIWVESREGEGSTFFVELPLSGAPSPAPAENDS